MELILKGGGTTGSLVQAGTTGADTRPAMMLTPVIRQPISFGVLCGQYRRGLEIAKYLSEGLIITSYAVRYVILRSKICYLIFCNM